MGFNRLDNETEHAEHQPRIRYRIRVEQGEGLEMRSIVLSRKRRRIGSLYLLRNGEPCQSAALHGALRR